jgi:hypothetical protein
MNAYRPNEFAKLIAKTTNTLQRLKTYLAVEVLRSFTLMRHIPHKWIRVTGLFQGNAAGINFTVKTGRYCKLT